MDSILKNLTIEDMKTDLMNSIDSYEESIICLSKNILSEPETGYREYKTSQKVSTEFQRFNIQHETGLAITGIKAVLDCGNPGPTIAVMGELDSLMVPGHPYANPDTGAAHACGHHCQIGSLVGVAIGLKESGVLKSLSGRVIFLAVPAEEYIEIEFRDELRRQGIIEFLGGKAEFIRLGILDDVDIAIMTHTDSYGQGGYDVSSMGMMGVGATSNGMIAKKIRFQGVASHAGGAPHEGVNALNAANIALSAIHAQRETFQEEENIRVHPIVTKGGASVSSVPADVRMETFVRGKTIEAILSASEKVDRAIRAGAMAVGAKVSITTIPGYLPIRSDSALEHTYRSNAELLMGSECVFDMGHRSGSTDMGDVSHLIPAIHPYVSVATGKAHGDDYVIEDYKLGVSTSAKIMAATIVDLLANGGLRASEIIDQYSPSYTKNDYLSLLRNLAKEETYK